MSLKKISFFILDPAFLSLTFSPFSPNSHAQNRSTLTKTIRSDRFLVFVVWSFRRGETKAGRHKRGLSFVYEEADARSRSRCPSFAFFFLCSPSSSSSFSLGFFPFWPKGLFRSGTLGDYLMEVEHAEMSGIGESHGGWHRTEKGHEERRSGGSWRWQGVKGEQKDERTVGSTKKRVSGRPTSLERLAPVSRRLGNVAIPRGTIKYLTGVFSGFTVRRASRTESDTVETCVELV